MKSAEHYCPCAYYPAASLNVAVGMQYGQQDDDLIMQDFRGRRVVASKPVQEREERRGCAALDAGVGG